MNKDMEKQHCLHDPNKANTTLLKIDRREMVLPEKGYFICPLCQKTFSFVKGLDNRWHRQFL